MHQMVTFTFHFVHGPLQIKQIEKIKYKLTVHSNTVCTAKTWTSNNITELAHILYQGLRKVGFRPTLTLQIKRAHSR